MKKPPSKILIIRFSSIGDIVLTTPVIRCLKQQLGAEVHYLCKKSYRPVLAANPYIDRIYTIENKVSEVLPELKKEQYNYIIDLHNNLRSSQIKLSLRKKSFTFNKVNLQKWLMVKFKINRLPNRHIVDRYMDAVKPLGVTNDDQGLDYFLEDERLEARDKRKTSHLLSSLESHSLLTSHFSHRTSRPYIAFAIGAAHQTKRLPEDKIVAICKGTTLPVLLLGGPGEKEQGARIAQASGEHVINTCGHFSLNQSALAVKHAWKVITHDTGMMHIAAAFHKDIISVWGNTIPEFGMYPYLPGGKGSNTTFEVQNLPCRPCSKIGYQACPKGHFNCMMQISVDQVVKQLILR